MNILNKHSNLTPQPRIARGEGTGDKSKFGILVSKKVLGVKNRSEHRSSLSSGFSEAALHLDYRYTL